MIFTLVLLALSVSGTFSGVPNAISVRNDHQCKAPNGGGLEPIFEEFLNMIPINDVLTIYTTAITSDPEVQEVAAYLETDNFIKLIQSVQAAPEFTKLMKFACDNLYLDMYYYFNLVGGFLGLPPVQHPPSAHLIQELRARPGLQGMILDMADVVPLKKLIDLFEEKAKSDEYVKKALKLMSSEDFKSIVRTVEGMKEFKDLTDELRKIGIDVDTIISAIKTFFGWN